jgi:hypothetical protein
MSFLTGEKMNKIMLCTVVLAALSSPAWAVNKCTGADGKVAFQDAPCAGGKSERLVVRPASGDGALIPQAPSSSLPSGEKPKTETQRLQGLIDESQRKRRIQELEVRQVPIAQGAIYEHRKACDDQLKALQIKKYAANNNLAGATWEGSISGEMTAIATRCDTRNRELKDDYDTLRKECQVLGGCK